MAGFEFKFFEAYRTMVPTASRDSSTRVRGATSSSIHCWPRRRKKSMRRATWRFSFRRLRRP